ncbi:glutamate transport system permease protein [Prauserella aidingensis]|uniref:amino acid ABC transporter permease n=1 Tax=Prauserella aidingensis TaxID=387890 RepID=UPI0020A41551|nr:amino acid ABC transporter permease [Prauserella aidingensis]MCP2252210.1 glutamate transport system permease protein [Prauserella aidingensis]
MSAPSVLYDVPGPKAKARNAVYTVLFLAALAGVAWWIIATLAEKDQLTWEKWGPFFTDGQVWTTFIFPGLLNTLLAAGLAIVIALPLGSLFGILRLSDHVWVRVPAGTVVEFFRAVPVLILMVFADQFYSEYTDIDSDYRPLVAVVTALVLYNGAVLAEVVRAGIQSLPAGQTEAAKAIGMRKTQTMTNVLLPQAVTSMLPAIVSQLVVILKDTALGGAALGFADLFNQIRPIANNYFANTIATMTIVALIYIVLNNVLTFGAGWLEKWSRQRKTSTGAVVKPVDDNGRNV